MTPQMENIVNTLAGLKEALASSLMDIADEPDEVLDEETFCTILSGIPSFRRLPGVSKHMGFKSIYHCETDEDAAELRQYLNDVFGIKDIETLTTQSQVFYHFFNEYYDFVCDWNGQPNFDINDIPEHAAKNYIASREFAMQLRDLVQEHGFLAWDIGERIMLIRAACACHLISDDEYRRLIVDEGRKANDMFDNFGDYAISALAGAVYFMFVSMDRHEDEGLSGFLDINLKIVSSLFQSDVWNLNAWLQKEYKQLAIADDQIKDLLDDEYAGMTGIASDRILCDGYQISAMLRQKPEIPSDSGWRFFAGDESAEYLGDHKKFGTLDLNLIVNYSPDVIPYLDLPVGSFVVRDMETKELRIQRRGMD